MKISLSGAILTAVIFGLASLSWGQNPAFSLALSSSLTAELSIGQKEFMQSEFPGLVKEFTLLPATINQGDDYKTLAKKLEEGQIQLAVFPGIEYAWISQRFKDIEPLMVTTYKKTPVRALLITKKDGPATFAELRDTEIGWLKQSREHCRLFLERLCKNADSTPKTFFKKCDSPKNGETALDDVILGKTQACVVDEVAWNIYRDIKPGGYNRLKVLDSSERFPPPVLAFSPGKISDKILTQFRTGMLKANNSTKAQDVMTMFKITTFENVPEQYSKMIEDILKAYPEGTGD